MDKSISLVFFGGLGIVAILAPALFLIIYRMAQDRVPRPANAAFGITCIFAGGSLFGLAVLCAYCATAWK